MEQPVRVGERRAELHAARRGIDDAADGLDAARLVVDRPVVETQLHVGHVFQRVVDRTVLAREVQQLVLGHREIDVHLRIVRYGSQRLRRRRTDQRAHLVGQCTHDSVRGTGHDRIGEVVGGVHALCFGLCELRLGRQQVVLGRRKVELRNYLACEKFLLAVVGQLSGRNTRLGGGDVGFGRLQSCLIGNLVDDEKRLPVADALPLVYADLGDLARYLRIDCDILTTADRRRVIHRNGTVGRSHCQDVVLRTLGLHRRLTTAEHEKAAGECCCTDRIFLHVSFFLFNRDKDRQKP